MSELEKENDEVVDRDCPKCGEHKLVVKWGRNGKFLACPGFPECKYTESLEPEEREATDQICDQCNSPMVIIKRGTSKFLGCSNYPDCNNIQALTTGVKCPEDGCEGELAERSTRRGKIFFGCNQYPECSYATWDKPLAEKCGSCGFPILTKKTTKAKGAFKQCPSCKVNFEASESFDVESED
jgi:DNA topoisomerase-1